MDVPTGADVTFQEFEMGRITTLAVVALLVSACGEPTAPEAPHAGRYALTAVDGLPLPVTMTPSPRVELRGRVLTLARDGRFTDEIALWLEVDGVSHPLLRHKEGLYRVHGQELSLTYTGGRTVVGRVGGDVLALNDRGVIFVLER